ncbi:MAG: TIGR01777 family protein [Ignavibacteriae bacterium]|nr:TIGR01777 family protein [Ignavibacteriota bacterium]
MNAPSKIVISGATGFLGKYIIEELTSKGYSICIFSRNAESARKNLGAEHEYVNWDCEESPELLSAIEGSKAVIHLAGANIAGKRWSESYKREIIDSRRVGTSAIARTIASALNPPEVWFSTSAVGYYGNGGDEIKKETSAPSTDFLSNVCNEWEAATSPAEKYCRIVRGRIGVVLHKEEGALAKMLLPFRLWLGGSLGSGRQWLSWVHYADVAGMIVWAIENSLINGAMNIVSPNPLPMKKFAATIGKVLNKPFWFPVPEFVLKLILGEHAWIVITGQRVEPEVAVNHNYPFHFTDLETALKDLLC